MPERISPYIHDQRWSLLTDHSRLRADLDARNFRPRSGAVPAGRGIAETEAEQRPDPWCPVENRDDVTFDRLVIEESDGKQRRISLRRVIVTTDAGIGKSEAIHWLLYRFNQPDTEVLALRLNAAELEGGLPEFRVTQDQLDAAVQNWLAGQIAMADESRRCPLADALMLVQRLRLTGRLVILIDGLDHVATALPNLRHLLDAPFWRHCRFILAGRPYALQTHFQELQLESGWAFLRLEEFDEFQQRRYLGVLYEAIPPQARPALHNVLTIPRVLYYLRHHVGAAQFRLIRTAADVYWIAIRQMIKEAMNGSGAARRLGLRHRDQLPEQVSETQLRCCRDLLAAIAYVMTLGTFDRRRLSSGITAPNFERVTEGRMGRFEEELERRYQSTAAQGLMQDMEALAAMNEFLSRGVFDSDVTGFREIEFRNRSLQEFLAAYYLCTRATKEDGDLWWDRLYLPHDPESEQFYHVWQFVTEMTGTVCPGVDSDGTGPDVPSAILEEHWLEAVAPLYRPTFVDRHGERDARRSCEMIFRTWPQLQRLCDENDPRALEIRERWLGEFESILADGQGPDRRAAARELVDDLLRIPAGVFQMGSSPEKGPQLLAAQRDWWSRWHRLTQAPGADVSAIIDQTLEQFMFPTGRAGGRARQEWAVMLNRLAEIPSTNDALLELASQLYPANETPADRQQVIEQDFLLGRSPVINVWWRLFIPRHGLRGEFAEYERISGTDAHPAIYIDWYSAWCFCLWAHWDRRSCRLPWENEWEYAAKFGTPWDQRYWWGDEWDGAKATGGGSWQTYTTTVPTPAHASGPTRTLDVDRGRGLMELLGNVWEWCQDIYRHEYKWHAEDQPGEVAAHRCVRGGSFSNDPVFCRSSFRNGRDPSSSYRILGVRLSRAASD